MSLGLPMPLASMTGFARIRGSHGDTQWAWELKSVNGRGLDVRLRAPPGFDGLEGAVREAIGQVMARGSVQALLTIDRPLRPPQVRVNEGVLQALLAASEAVRQRTGAPPATVDGLFAVRGVVEVIDAAETEAERAALQAAVLDGVKEAARALVTMRRHEGQTLADIIGRQLGTIASLIARAETLPARQPAAIRARLEEQVKALLDTGAGFDADRLHQEAILIATKADVREEIDRLQAHVVHAHRLLAEEGAIGRKLDFLAQEFNREANTLCSKSNDRELTEIGLSLKTTIDQLREQIQNVE